MEQFLLAYQGDSSCMSIEEGGIEELIECHDEILIGYPIYYSQCPKIMADFIAKQKSALKGKKIFLIATMGLFCGDGCGCVARLLKNQSHIIGGLHLKMPDCIGDEKVLKNSFSMNRQIIENATMKIKKSAKALSENQPHKDGLGLIAHVCGFLGQRCWFYSKTNKYANKPKIDHTLCIGCGKCIQCCPMHNLKKMDGRIIGNHSCTLCYRCFAHCPTQAITILGKKVSQQYTMDAYL